MKRLLLQLLALWSFSLSRCESTFVPYDYSATVEASNCLDKPLKPQYNGGIIVNPDLRDGPQAWLPFGNAKIEFKDIGHDKFVVARERKQPHDSVSQKVHLEKGRLYTFSAWLQVNNGKAPVSAVFKTNGEYKHAGSVIAESKCWSMLKGGLTVDESGPGELYFESNDTRVEIWVDSVSLQPFTQEEWKSHQDHSIHKERKRTVRIRVVNSKGEPVQKASLSIEQRKLGFPFGCEVEKNILGNHAYQSWFTKRFTVTTFANEMKWYSTEVVRGKEDYSIADKMFRFFKKHGVAVRGHNIVWSDPKYQTKWLNSLSGREFYNAVKQRVSSVASRYKGQLEGWDVVNENLHFSYFEKKMGPKASRNIFKMAQAFDPTTTKFINEYNTLEEPRDLDSSPAKFLKKLRELKSIVVRGNISLGIGLESHFKTPNIPFMRSALDILGATDLPIWLTEVDVEAPKNVQRTNYFIVRTSKSSAGCEEKYVPYDYSATIECLGNPNKPQYNGGIIVNPDLQNGSQGWSQLGNAKVDFTEFGGNKFVIARGRNQSYDSVSQKVYLEKGLLYTFSAWLQVSQGNAPVRAVFKKNGEYKLAGSVIAESKCWSMLKGGLTVDESGPADLLFESEDTCAEIWVDSVSLQPFTQEEWNSHHEQSINMKRKGSVRIRAVNSAGEPVPNATISILQNKLGFPFGCAVESNILGNQAYQDWFTKRFTVTTFGNEMKWYSTEVVRGKEDYSTADAMVKLFQQHGIAIRGHNIIWDNPIYQPSWVKALSVSDLYNAVKRRVFSVVTRYKGQLAGWDVVNENLHFSFLESKFGPKASYNVFAQAHALDPTTTMFMNEYNTLEQPGDSVATPARYLQKLRELQSIHVAGNIPLGIGLQSHFSTPNIPYMRSALDTLAATGLPIWLTEIDVAAPPNVQFIWEVNSLLSPSHSHSQYRYRVAQQNKVRNLKQGCEEKNVPYDYSATIECLGNPNKPQYNGGIIVNPDLQNGSQGWSQMGNTKVDFTEFGGNKFVIARGRNQSYDSVSQKVYLEKGLLYTFSAWLQVSKGNSPVRAVFKKNGKYKHAGSVIAESKCWSMLKGGLTVDESGPADLYFESEDTTAEIWVDSVSLQPFTQEEWSSHHKQSIDITRKGAVRIRAVNSAGEPVPNATISILQNRLGFPFGCSAGSNILGNQAFQDWFTKRFTVTVFENEMKWYSTEVVRGKEDYSTADAMVRLFKQHGIAIRGHHIILDDPKYQPSWVTALNGPDLYNAVKRRVDSVVSRYKGQLASWDVVNENLHFSFFENKMGPKVSYNVFEQAHAVDPTTTMFMNEFNTLEQPGDAVSSPARYLQKLRELQSIRVPGNISLGIGLESHFFNTPNIPYMRSALDTLGATGLPIWLTEVDVAAPPNVQANYFEQVLREGHAHPKVTGMVTWSGYNPRGCFRMCLTDGNFRNLPTGDVVDKLLREWGGLRGKTTGLTDADGYFEASLFHGDYDLSIAHPLTNSTASHSFKLTSDDYHPSPTVVRV
ncbi:unnamed protein product [Brassica rapa]|uniref:GH10 domain-containing protein n=2 Tax=Brassica TaxID=3705 RepID=A0A8D9M616_BRACM|nr:unnamed protein product [Brassica napus]CAG7898270.1 unnamed protein product [Brassica rapa]